MSVSAASDEVAALKARIEALEAHIFGKAAASPPTAAAAATTTPVSGVVAASSADQKSVAAAAIEPVRLSLPYGGGIESDLRRLLDDQSRQLASGGGGVSDDSSSFMMRVFSLIEYYRKPFLKMLRPKRIILIRHGQSMGNVDPTVYSKLADNKIPLTETGIAQAVAAGKTLQKLVGGERLRVCYSPFKRTCETANYVLSGFPASQYTLHEDPTIREQEWGNLPDNSPDTRAKQETERDAVGSFYYRFANGESGADVFNRAALFLEHLFRYYSDPPTPQSATTPAAVQTPASTKRASTPTLASAAGALPVSERDDPDAASAAATPATATVAPPPPPPPQAHAPLPTDDGSRTGGATNRAPNVLIVSHGLFLRLLLMRFFRWTVAQFHVVCNFENCEILVLEKQAAGHYKLVTPLRVRPVAATTTAVTTAAPTTTLSGASTDIKSDATATGCDTNNSSPAATFVPVAVMGGAGVSPLAFCGVSTLVPVAVKKAAAHAK